MFCYDSEGVAEIYQNHGVSRGDDGVVPQFVGFQEVRFFRKIDLEFGRGRGREMDLCEDESVLCVGQDESVSAAFEEANLGRGEVLVSQRKRSGCGANPTMVG